MQEKTKNLWEYEAILVMHLHQLVESSLFKEKKETTMRLSFLLIPQIKHELKLQREFYDIILLGCIFRRYHQNN